MNRRAVRWAVACAVLGAAMLGLGINAALSFHPSSTDDHQVLTLGQLVDIITAAALLVIAALITLGQVRAARQRSRHRRWIRDHAL